MVHITNPHIGNAQQELPIFCLSINTLPTGILVKREKQIKRSLSNFLIN